MAKKIMLVEDDNNLREIYEARLTAEGYEIVAAENGEAALAMAAKERPDMIISDVMMPKISGFEMLDILRNTDGLKNTKIIMLTALGQSEDSQRANSLGADRYLVKSQVTLEDIVKAAHDLLDDPNTMAAVSQPSDTTVAPEVASEAPTDEAAPAPQPTENSDLPAAEPVAEAPAEPAMSVAPEPAADAAAVTPEMTVSPAPDVTAPQVVEPQAQPEIPVTEPTASEPATVPEPAAEPADASAAPAPEPAAAAPSVISIPVSDGSDDATAAAADGAVDASSMVSEPAASVPDPAAASDMPVIEPPQEITPESESAVAQSAPGETISPVAAAPADTQSLAEPAPTEASAIEAQINEFINNQASEPGAEAPAPETPTADAAATTMPETPAPEQTAQPSVEIPSVVAEPNVSTETDLPADNTSAQGPADTVPTPEELDSFSAPVIDAPEGQSIPEPQDVPVPAAAPVETASETAPEPAAEVPTPEAPAIDAQDSNADQLREAAEGLAAGAGVADSEQAAAIDPTQPVSSNATNRMRTIAPITSSEVKPDINQLLALEEAKNGALQAAQNTEAPRPNADAYTPSAQTAPQQPAQQPIDPNSISL